MLVGDAERVGGGAVAGDFGQNRRAAFLRVVERFQNDHAGAFAEDEAAAAGVKGAAAAGGAGFVGKGDDAQRFPGFHGGVGEGHVASAGDHQLGFAVADAFVRFADGGRGRGTGGNVGETGVGEAELDRDLRGGGVAHADHDRHRRQALAAVLPHFLVGPLDGGVTAQGGAPGDAEFGPHDPLAALEAGAFPYNDENIK